MGSSFHRQGAAYRSPKRAISDFQIGVQARVTIDEERVL